MDGRVIIGLPVKLAVCLLVIGLMTPVVMDAMEDAETETSLLNLRTEAMVLADAIGDVYYGGVGSSVSLSLSIPPGQSIEVGGDGADAYMLRLLDDGENADVVYLDRPAVPVLNDAVSLSGACDVTLRCTVQGGVYGVEIVP